MDSRFSSANAYFNPVREGQESTTTMGNAHLKDVGVGNGQGTAGRDGDGESSGSEGEENKHL